MRSLDTSTSRAADSANAAKGGTQSPLWTRNSVAALAMLTAAATVLRFLFLVRKPFWFDECFSVEVARLRWRDFFQLLWHREANMALYYLLLRGWLHFGSSPFFIRSLSVILSLAAVWAIYWLGAKLFDRRVGLLSAALLSFNAYHIRYAQEARSYSLFVLLAILSSGFFVAALRNNLAAARSDTWSPAFWRSTPTFTHSSCLRGNGFQRARGSTLALTRNGAAESCDGHGSGWQFCARQ